MDKKQVSEAFNRAAQARGIDPQKSQSADASKSETSQNAQSYVIGKTGPVQFTRTTSAAKELDPKGLEGTSLGRQAPLKPAFDHAKQPRAQSIEKQEEIKPPSRKSAANLYDPKGLDGTSLARAPDVKSAFDKARAVQQKPQQQQQRDKTMVEKTGNHHRMHPPSHMRQGPDRQVHNAKLSNERTGENAKNADAKARMDAINARRNQADRAKMKDDQSKDGPDLH